MLYTEKVNIGDDSGILEKFLDSVEFTRKKYNIL